MRRKKTTKEGTLNNQQVMARRRYGGGNVGMQRDWVAVITMAAPARLGRRAMTIAVKVGQRRQGGGGGDLLGGGHAGRSHGENMITVILFFLSVNLLSILLPCFIAITNAISFLTFPSSYMRL